MVAIDLKLISTSKITTYDIIILKLVRKNMARIIPKLMEKRQFFIRIIRAPSGCRQYHEEISGTFKSFNHEGKVLLAKQSYSICFKKHPGNGNNFFIYL